MVSRIRDELKRSSSAIGDNVVKRSIVSSLHNARYERYWFNEDWMEFVTVASQQDYVDGDFLEDDGTTNLPLDQILEIDFLRAQPNSYWYRLERRTFDSIDDDFYATSVSSGYPINWAFGREVIRLYPIPSAVYRVEGKILRDIPDGDGNVITAASDDADTNAWFTVAEEYIRNRAKADIYQSFLMDPDNAMLCLQIAGSAKDRLINATERKLTSGVRTEYQL